MIHERFLYPFRAVFFPVIANQQALIPAKDEQKSIPVQVTQVARMQPAIFYGLICSFWVSPVARHHIPAFDDNFSFLSGGAFPAFLIQDPQFKVLYVLAGTTQFMYPRGI